MALTSLKLFSFKKGVSLVELLVGMAIASGVSLGIVGIYMAHFRIFTNQNALIEAETQNKLAMNEVLKYSKEAIKFAKESHIIGAGNGETTVLGLTLLPLDASGNPYNPDFYDIAIIRRDPGDPSKLIEYGITYASSTTRKLMKRGDPDTYLGDGLQPPKVIATGVTDLNIAYNDSPYTDADQATITLKTAAKTIFGKTFTSNQTATIYIRN